MLRFFSGLSLVALAFSLLVAASYLDTPSWTTWQQVAYGVLMLAILLVGIGLLATLDKGQTDEVNTLFDRICLASVPLPRYSTTVLLGLSGLFAGWSYNWTVYNTFTGLVAGTLLCIALGRSVLHALNKAAVRAKEKARQEKLRERCLPWVGTIDN
jgi:hypothetical protein